MLRTRILTAAILAVILLAGLFLLPPPWAVLAFGALFTLGAWEWSGFGGLHAGTSRALYAAAFALLSFLAWQWSAAPAHLLLLLGTACAWWAIALLWLSFVPPRPHPMLALLCGLPVLLPAFIALARLQVVTSGFARGPQIVLWLVLMTIAADVGAYFAGRKFGRRKLEMCLKGSRIFNC